MAEEVGIDWGAGFFVMLLVVFLLGGGLLLLGWFMDWFETECWKAGKRHGAKKQNEEKRTHDEGDI